MIDDSAWDYLFAIYGGYDIPRYSIEIANEEDTSATAEKEYMIEIYYKRVQVYILPRGSDYLTLRKKSSIFISRKATVLDYHRKVAEILLPN